MIGGAGHDRDPGAGHPLDAGIGLIGHRQGACPHRAEAHVERARSIGQRPGHRGAGSGIVRRDADDVAARNRIPVRVGRIHRDRECDAGRLRRRSSAEKRQQDVLDPVRCRQ